MIVKKCDRCKKEFDLGYKIKVRINAENPCVNVYPFTLQEREYDICLDCIGSVAEFLRPKEEQESEVDTSI